MNNPQFVDRFTGADMLKIDIANTFGLDKETFAKRISWFNSQENDIIENTHRYIVEAEEPLMFQKAVTAYTRAKNGEAIGHNVFMDATASGLQIMAVLSGCKQTAKEVNLVNTGIRNDTYTNVNNRMCDTLGVVVPRKDMKKATMTHYYNSKAKPKEIFNNDEEKLNAFYKVLRETYPGAEAVMNIINSAWDSNKLYHQWTLPDGHVAHVKVTDEVSAKIDVQELPENTFTYKFYPNQASEKSTSLSPNVIHSLDAYVVREVVRRANFEVAHIHDAFTCHPNNMPVVMDLYREILAEMAEEPILENIISEITGTQIELCKYSNDLADEIRNSEYALS